MNPYDKLDHAERAWTMAETAAFLGYSVRHLYRLVRQNKIDGWSRVEGRTHHVLPLQAKGLAGTALQWQWKAAKA